MKTSIDISELRKGANGDTVKELADFLDDKLANVKVDTSGSEVTIVYEEDYVLKRSYLRILLRKFLHKSDLKEDFRVIAGNEASFVLKKRREREE